MESTIYKFDNCIVRVHIPGTSPEERQKRIYDATEQFLREVSKERMVEKRR